MIFKTTDEITKEIAERFKKIRKSKKITQKELALESNVSYGTIKRFETTGEISLHTLVKLCVCLDITEEMNNLFEEVPYTDINEVIKYGKQD